MFNCSKFITGFYQVQHSYLYTDTKIILFTECYYLFNSKDQQDPGNVTQCLCTNYSTNMTTLSDLYYSLGACQKCGQTQFTVCMFCVLKSICSLRFKETIMHLVTCSSLFYMQYCLLCSTGITSNQFFQVFINKCDVADEEMVELVIFLYF